MINKLALALLVLCLISLFSTACRSKENIELLKSDLNVAINASDPFEAARLIGRLVKSGADPKTLPVAEAAELISGKVSRAYNWEAITGGELVRLCGPLEGLTNGTWSEHPIRAAFFWGLMETGRRGPAFDLWKKSENQVLSTLGSPMPFRDVIKLPPEERGLRISTSLSAIYFAIGFVSSRYPEDRRQGVELAKKVARYYDNSLTEDKATIRLSNPIAQAQMPRLTPHESLLAYCLVKSGLWADASVNPYLKDQPETAIRFEPVRNAGFEDCSLRPEGTSDTRLALGDYDDDGYTDVLVSDRGLWRNLGGSGTFRRVDQALGLDVRGIVAAFADVDNDGLADVIVAGKDKFGVSLQTRGGIFRPVLSPADGISVNASAIGLFDGDGDGLIDVYLGKNEEGANGRTTVLRNKGSGKFEEVTDAWGFKGDDIQPPAQGVNPGDYDDDGRTDIYVSNYRAKRNVLWRNVTQNGKAAFVQCAAAPWFGTDTRPEIQEGPDRGVEGWRTDAGVNSYWGHTSGAAWGDLNGDGTLDLVCANLSHARFVLMNPPLMMDLSRVYLNTGHGFQDHTIESGLVYRETNTDPLLADFDNDGRLDLSITNCYRAWINQLYVGTGDGSFREVTFRTGAFAASACGQAAADFDNDGDLDWFVFDGNRGMLVYENKLIEAGKTPAAANWIELKLRGGRQTNGMAYGARVTVTANDRSFVREVAGMRGFSSGDDPVVHIGLGKHKNKVDVRVRWTGNKFQDLSGLEVNRRHEIRETEK
jgi:hypothetical protein